MATICPSCSTENNAGASFCRDCGTELASTPDAPELEASLTCPSCDAPMSPEALFCRACGAERSAGETPTGTAGTLPPVVLIAAGGAAVIVVAAIAAVLIWTNGDDDTTPTTADRSLAANSAVLAEISDAVAAIPATAGDTDLEQMRSLLGSPEAFTIALEVDNEGVSTRREEWFYYELRSIYEFVDGTLVSNLPIEAENAFLILPIQYDPDQFELGVTWDQVAETLGGREGMESFTLEPEFESDATVYAGNQLLLMFDEAGLLFYVEAIPLAQDEPQ